MTGTSPFRDLTMIPETYGVVDSGGQMNERRRLLLGHSQPPEVCRFPWLTIRRGNLLALLPHERGT